MYKRIYDSDEIVVDYYNDGKPMVRVSVFEDGHWTDEHFVELPEEVEPVVHAHWEFYMDETGDWWDKCSACGGKLPNEGGYCCGLPRCPECGAHMDEEVVK